MLKCMAANGFLSQDMAVKITPMEPYEYLQTAELNQRSVGFIPAGTQVCALLCHVAQMVLGIGYVLVRKPPCERQAYSQTYLLDIGMQ